MNKGSAMDPKGLISESYKIDGITVEECRSIFLDWALSLPVGIDSKAAIGVLLTQYTDDAHPMTGVLRAGLSAADQPKRRGGARSRLRG